MNVGTPVMLFVLLSDKCTWWQGVLIGLTVQLCLLPFELAQDRARRDAALTAFDASPEGRRAEANVSAWLAEATYAPAQVNDCDCPRRAFGLRAGDCTKCRLAVSGCTETEARS